MKTRTTPVLLTAHAGLGPRPLRTLALALGGLAVVGWPCAASARQDAPAPAAAVQASAEPLPARREAVLELTEAQWQDLCRDSLARLATVRLREAADPTLEDYRLTALALRVARRLSPTDAELLRLEIDAWSAAQDDREVTAATERLIELDPRDTVAQLRLLSSRIGRLQSADERLAAYNRLLGEAGRALDPSIRSRLALDAALLHRESGDEEAFVRLLREATALDVTNKDAATLFATIFLERATDPQERVDILANVVLSDPTDLGAHLSLGYELFKHGAFSGAKRFLSRVADLRAASGEGPSPQLALDLLILEWMSEGPDACLELLLDAENKTLSNILASNREEREVGKDPGPDPEYAVLPMEQELVRQAIAFGRGETEALAKAASRVRESLDGTIKQIDEAVNSPDVSRERLEELRRSTILSRAVARLVGNFEVEQALEDVALLTGPEAAAPLSAEATARLKGWAALRSGDVSGASAMLGGVAEGDDVAALGHALAAELESNTKAAIARYARLALRSPQSLPGASARTRVMTLLGTPVEASPAARSLDQWAAGFAPWIDGLTKSAANITSITAEHIPPRVGPFDRPMLRVVLRNTSRAPLGLGPERTINSRLLLTPRLIAMREDLTRLTEPEVLHMERRLRLMPNEELTVDVWCTRGRLGTLFDVFSGGSVTLRWRVLQGFLLTQQGSFAPGPLCVYTQSSLLTRDSIDPPTSAKDVAARIRESQGRALAEAILSAAVQGSATASRAAEIRDQYTLMAEAVAERVPDLTAYQRVWLMPLGVRGGLMHADTAIFDALRDDESPYVKAGLLLLGFESDDDPTLLKLLEDADPDIRAMAKAARDAEVVAPLTLEEQGAGRTIEAQREAQEPPAEPAQGTEPGFPGSNP